MRASRASRLPCALGIALVGALAFAFDTCVVRAQSRADVTISADPCVAPARAQLDDALALELRTLPEYTASWTRETRATAGLRCSDGSLVVSVMSRGELCGGESRLDATRIGTPEFPRLAALTIVELVESCYESQHRGSEQTTSTPEVPADTGETVPEAMLTVSTEHDEDSSATRELAAPLGAPEPGMPPLREARAVEPPAEGDQDEAGERDEEALATEVEAPRWTIAPVLGVLFSPRAQLFEPMGGVDVSFVPRSVLGLATSLQVGGMPHTVERATLRHRFVRLGTFGTARVTGRPLALSVGLGYVLAANRFIGDSVDADVVGERRTVLEGGPALRVGLDGLLRQIVIPLRLEVGWMTPRVRLRDEVGTLLLTWGGPYVLLTVGLGATSPASEPRAVIRTSP